MKTQKIITIITVILLVAIISSASFIGIYKKEEYRVSNIVPDYKLGMEFTDSRLINFEVNKEENSEENLTIENYKKTESIIKSRLKGLGVDQYRVVLDETTGNIQVRIQENEDTDIIIYDLLQSGVFELKDSETEEVLIGTNTIEKADVMYSQENTGTAVNLRIKFNKEGMQKLQELRKEYALAKNEEGEDVEEKSIVLYFNEQLITAINLEQSLIDEMLYIQVGVGNTATSLETYKTVAKEVTAILNSGVLPLSYTETDNIERASIATEQMKIGIYVALGILGLMAVIYIIKLKTKGLLASILQIGYIALLLLVLRYTNVKITIEGIAGILISSVLNFIYIYIAFRKIDLNFVKDVTAKFALKLIPVYLIAIVLSFNSLANIYSLGMTLVWGIIVMYIYNLILTQITLNTLKK